ncbi:putative S-adenosyl-L-methionine-dependent methyltransferase protein [Corchorus capsularis]|uniref:Putative S-adenosyl-L-methionine-dependent methyltransferase protein n=1 Tax=Corchorus capsularis TaxID=210143 RepID=A0A1R3K2U4_COCAP|nr:putative S-adenosyl-L-methionine-dependent methyltransferase protein [Corchorus capsularis]
MASCWPSSCAVCASTCKHPNSYILKFSPSNLQNYHLHCQRHTRSPTASYGVSFVDEDFTDSDESESESEREEGSTQSFKSGELLNYTALKLNRQIGKKNFLGLEAISPSVGLACAKMASNIDRFMSYKIYQTCPDDWDIAQKLMLNGCDPLPRRRCFSKAPPRYTEFTIDEVLKLKSGEIRIGLDFSPTTGTFAALMRERNVTIASATLNLGAPFNEVIALRGLLPLYLSVGSRLPFFDNTLDIIHSTLFLDGWIGIELLQFVLFDWDRVLRPKGLLWVDRFFCKRDDLKIYLDEFSRLEYKKLLWRVVPKTDKLEDEFYFSAILEKPIRS